MGFVILSPGAMSTNVMKALVGEVEMSIVPVLNVFAPTDWVSVNRAPVTLTTVVAIAIASSSPAVMRRGRLPRGSEPNTLVDTARRLFK